MSPLIRLLLPLTLLILSWSATANNASTRYVAGDHSVELLTGFSDQDHSIASLTPGESVQLLKLNKKEGEARIQRESGEVGWVKVADLSETPPAKETPSPTVETSEPKTADQLQQELGRLQSELIQMRAASADILRAQAERDQLQSTVISLKRELETLSQEKNALAEDQKQTWFLIGGLILLGGVLLGVLLPRISVRRSNQWGSF